MASSFLYTLLKALNFQWAMRTFSCWGLVTCIQRASSSSLANSVVSAIANLFQASSSLITWRMGTVLSIFQDLHEDKRLSIWYVLRCHALFQNVHQGWGFQGRPAAKSAFSLYLLPPLQGCSLDWDVEKEGESPGEYGYSRSWEKVTTWEGRKLTLLSFVTS